MASGNMIEKMAKKYDAEILPVWAMKFGKLLLKNLEIPEKGMLLDVGCGTGYPALDILSKQPDGIRIIAIDNASPMMEIARKKAGELSGKKIFFRTENAFERLSFADDVYDLTYSNLALMELGDPLGNLTEFSRVTNFNGQVAVTLPVSGSWAEFFDIFRDVLTKRDKYEILNSLTDYEEKRVPFPETVVQWMESAGLKDVKYEIESFELLFKSAKEFFFDPVIEYGPLKEWKSIVPDVEEMKEIFVDIKDSIDTLFSGLIFSVTVRAGCFIGTKPSEDEIEELGEDDLEIFTEDETP
ncbi:MAG: methyltransferase domain-containing protein [Deltaproteobacteria bacterium]|nr:methyltransferase domain-containing protein [Deltaproteobacteria bacterium]